MAAVILSRSPGRVFRFDEVPTPVTIQVEGFSSNLYAALTAVGVQSQANVQFVHTLKRMVYVYVFGEKIADMQLSGVVFPGVCGPAGAAGVGGFERVWAYYRTVGVAWLGRPVAVAVGATVFAGIVVGARIDLSDPNTGIGAFSLMLKFFPDD